MKNHKNAKIKIRVKISELKEVLKKLINNEVEFEKAGKIFDLGEK